MKTSIRHYTPNGGGHANADHILDPRRDKKLTHDETAYTERGEFRRGILDDELTDEGMTNDIRTSDDENVAPGA